MAKTVRVDLGPRSYDVQVGPELLSLLGETAVRVGGIGQVVVISDSTVSQLYGPQATDSLVAAGLNVKLLEFPAGEANKSLATAGRLYDELFAIEPAIDRSCLIIALGGGVPGDMAGMIAATALRGVRWLQSPTTLLADVDASVGGKTGVDHLAGKNLIGAFHQPSGVVIDVITLKTLPLVELRSGLAECVKHAVIRDASLLDYIEHNAEGILACDEAILTELVARNVKIKAGVVSADERESGQRAHLNFGHTVGHGIEAFLGYGGATHGQCVALGMIAACRISERKGLVDASVRERITHTLASVGLETKVAGLDSGEVWRIMQHDKKARAGTVRFVLPTELGTVDVYDDVPEKDVMEAISMLG